MLIENQILIYQFPDVACNIECETYIMVNTGFAKQFSMYNKNAKYLTFSPKDGDAGNYTVAISIFS